MRRITPAVFAEQLTDRDRLLWTRFLARRGIRHIDVSEITIDEDAREVEISIIDESRPLKFGLYETQEIARVRWHEIPLMRRTQRRLPEIDG